MFASPNIANASNINDGIEHNWELVEENAYIDTGTMSYSIKNEELAVWSKKIIESSEAEELRMQAKYAGVTHDDRAKISKIYTITELRNYTTINMVITYTVKRRIIYDINNNILYDFTNDNDKVYVGMGADGVAYMKCMNILKEAGKE